ncbi:hypothetical protein IMG5_156390 [Ichthyophthirius multifiliis]|uniref:Uncharacterized protein n=1 Tax=Ichthyophthirius multifiliis TaxID=5932 RepID=G0QZF9_ICHMU|nr:hypothetical protein IMG5_156390 [Ichthyophthirius multifiliis]EGR29397.1 hypothetical protein IMG5_156390 [Ichthyophthirius multifiliis]|eukprot:XP_004030633.1 hypothetical protein IMG5_156390 [Ichthyophthirius multifiliis]
MAKCNQKDINSFKLSKPALEKVQNVDEILKKLCGDNIQKEFLNQNGLDFVCDWIKEIPNGPEPPVSLKLKLLQFTLDLPVKRQHLEGIKLGKVLSKMKNKLVAKQYKNGVKY